MCPKGEQSPNYDEDYISRLFDQMGRSYDIVNLVSSLGFSQGWRKRCVSKLPIKPGHVVADLMAGSGECFPAIYRATGGLSIVGVDFSKVMCARQSKRFPKATVLCENVLKLSLPDQSVDMVASAFGLKTFNEDQLEQFARELFRILKAGGMASLVEISVPERFWFKGLYLFYISNVIPLLGRIFLRDVDCYRMLGIYTRAFGGCQRFASVFREAGFEVEVEDYFFGCATGLILTKSCKA